VVFVGVAGGVSDMIQDADGLWRSPRTLDNTVPSGQTGGPLGTDRGRGGIFERVSAATVEGKIHICAVEADGQIERNIFDPANAGPDPFDGWTDIEMKLGSDRGRFVDVACASVVNPATTLEELHICGVTNDGGLWHSVESPSRTFTVFGDVKGVSGDVGQFNRVDCAGNKSQLHLVGVTRNAVKAWHTIRIPTAWSPFANVLDQATGGPTAGYFLDVAVGFCNDGVPPSGNSDVSQLNVVLTGPPTQISGPSPRPSGIWHTIRSTNPVQWTPQANATNWRPMQDLSPILNHTVSSPDPTSDPRTWKGYSVGFRPMRPY
jgi:hypothetical protein